MGITGGRADRHVKEWESKLGATGYLPHRSRWPSRLFHHSPIENAARILGHGYLLSRMDSEGERKFDVAGASVIQNRVKAHQFARLYFRPRTPTQYWIEGIRKPENYWNGDPSAHAPTLVMLIFDSRTILTQDGVRFSTGNMQSYDAVDGDTDSFFDTIDFAKVYHDGSHNDPSITHCRCAEVLLPSPMPISDCLTAIHCRSVAERLTLLKEMGPRAASRLSQRIHVSDDLRVFEKRHTFVDTVSLQHDGIVFRLHPTAGTVAILVEAFDNAGRAITTNKRAELPVVPPNGRVAWRVPANLPNGDYTVRITIEGCRAFEADLLLSDGPF
jgi:hypothetical protein